MNFLQTLGLKSKNPDTRRETVDNLARESDPEILKYLYPLLDDPDVSVRKETVRAIASFREAETVPFLKKCFADNDRDVRTLAVGAFTKILGPEATRALLEAMQDKDFGVRKKAASVLDTRGWRPSTKEETVLYTLASGRFTEAAAEGEAAIELIANALQAESAATRQEAIRALSTIDSAKIFRYIANALKDGEASVRVTAVDALKSVRDARIFDPLVDALGDSEPHVRQVAAETLGNIGGVRAVAPLIDLLRDISPAARAAAAEGLGKIADARAVEPLLGTLSDDEREVRISAIQALGKLRDPQAIEPLNAMLTDEDADIRNSARSALFSIDANAQAAESAEALPASTMRLVPQMESELPSLGMAQPHGQMVEDVSTGGLDPIFAELEAADPAVRYRAALELAKIQNPRAIPPLFQRLFDEEDGVRKAAAEALETLGWQPEDEGQLAWHCVILRRWDHAVNLGASAVDSLIKALETFDPGSQKAAAESLGRVRDPRGVEPLLQAITSNDFGIRKAAVIALGEIGDPRALTGLMEAQGDKFKIVRDAAEQAILKLGAV